MSLALRFTFAFVITLACVMTVHAVLQAKRERALLETDTLQDNAQTARWMADCASELWQREGRDAAAAFIARSDAPDGRAHVRLRPPPPDGAASRRGEIREDAGNTAAVVSAAITLDGHAAGEIEITESLETSFRYVASSSARNLMAGLALAVVSGAVALALGVRLIGRPVQSIIAKTRRIARGDLDGPLAATESGELGELERAVNGMCESLLAARARVRHADRLAIVGRIASGLAHEIGTPLNVVSARARMIAQGETAAPDVAASAMIIHEQSDRIAGVIRQLLDFSRPRTIERGILDIAALTRQTAVLLSPILARAGVTVVVIGDPAVPKIAAGAGALQQVISNLLVNAVQAMPRGGTIHATVDVRTVDVPPELGSGSRTVVALALQDEGAGIAPELMDRLFDPFFSTKPPGEGTGLGLTVSAEVVREYGGWIDVQSQVGRGSIFTVMLPREVDDARARSAD